MSSFQIIEEDLKLMPEKRERERVRKREISCLYRDLRVVLGFWGKDLLIELLNLDKKPDLSLSWI